MLRVAHVMQLFELVVYVDVSSSSLSCTPVGSAYFIAFDTAQFRRHGYAFHSANGHSVAYLDPKEFLSADRSAHVCLHVRVRAYERNMAPNLSERCDLVCGADVWCMYLSMFRFSLNGIQSIRVFIKLCGGNINGGKRENNSSHYLMRADQSEKVHA